MTPEDLANRIPENEFIILTSRSSGPGGQNVNKVNSKVEIHFSILLSDTLSVREKELIFRNLKNKINSSGELVVKSQSERTQLRNRNKAIEKIMSLLSLALTEKPERKPTLPTLQSQAERVDEKKKKGRIKRSRKEDRESIDDF